MLRESRKASQNGKAIDVTNEEIQDHGAVFVFKNRSPVDIFDVTPIGNDARPVFLFVVKFSDAFNKESAVYKLRGFSFLASEYRLWLLGQFKRKLKEMLALTGMKHFHVSRTETLKDYCRYLNIDFDGLVAINCPPPLNVFKNESHCRKLSIDDVDLVTPIFKKIKKLREPVFEEERGEVPQRAARSNSLDEMVESSRPVASDARGKGGVACLLSKIDVLIQKYQRSERELIPREEFFQDLNIINDFINDL